MKNNTSRRLITLLALAGIGFAIPYANAASYTWKDSGTTGTGWSTAANWTSTGFPISGSTATDLVLRFNSRAATFTTTNNISGSLFVNRINFETGAGDAAITLTIASGAAPITFANNGTTGPSIVQNSGASILINGAGTSGVGGIVLQDNLTLTGTGSGAITVGTIVSGTAGLILDTHGVVSLNGVSTFSGGTTLQSGTLRMATGSATGVGLGTLTLNSGHISSASTTAKSLSNAVVTGSNSNVTFGDALLTGSLTFNGATTFRAGSHVSAESAVRFAGSVTSEGNVTFTQKDAAKITLNNFDAAGGVTFDLDLDGQAFSITNAFSNSDNSIINFSLSGGEIGEVYTLLTFGSTTISYDQLNLITGSGYFLDTSFGNGGWQINGNNLQVQLIPEPSTVSIAIAGISALGLLSLRRRRAMKND